MRKYRLCVYISGISNRSSNERSQAQAVRELVGLSFRRPGSGINIGIGSTRGARRFHSHGQANKQGVRCVRVVHGKGLGSPGKQPVLKTKTQRWLIQKNEVLAFVQAKPAEGGAGALVVLLAPVRR